jgi:hypothetical protein
LLDLAGVEVGESVGQPAWLVIAEDDELADVLGAAAAGLGVHEGGELLDRVEGVYVAGGGRVAYRPAALVAGGLGEQAGELDLAGADPPVGALPARSAAATGTTGTPVPSTAM